jgi:hypothetical protein
MREQELLQKFIDQVRWLYEPEYGDFKRKVGLYIERLEEAIPEAGGDGALRKTLADMKAKVVYNPNGDIESTRRQVIQMAHGLLGPHSGPLH